MTGNFYFQLNTDGAEHTGVLGHGRNRRGRNDDNGRCYNSSLVLDGAAWSSRLLKLL